MAAAENPQRERILERIRRGLMQEAPRREPPPNLGPVFAPVADPLPRFVQECEGNLTELVLTSSAQASAVALNKLLAELPAGPVFVQDAPALRELVRADGREVRWSSAGAPAEDSQACMTLCEALVAQTGSILVSAACGGRGGSIVAPVHVVFATRDQLVPDIETALTQAQQRGTTQNSFVGLITGSSRTADIEKILVQGAHGPRRLVVILQS